VDSFPKLDPACPWYSVKSLRLPKVKWCEDQLCSWIEEPANTWSNLAYIVAGFLMWRLSRDLKSKPLRFYGLAGVIVGTCSFTYHAANAFYLQLFDFFGMYLFIYLLIFVNLERLGRTVIRNSFGPYFATVTASTLLTLAVDYTSFPIQGLILGLILVVIGTEILAIQRSKKPVKMTWFYVSFFFISLGAVCSTLDVKRIACDPFNHVLQGHALWHLFGAFALFFSFLHHTQFDESLVSNRTIH